MAFQERFSRTENNIQLSYELPHRINAAISYPIPSSNGSQILLYAHENGVRVLWRGGRPFKPPAPEAKSNGANDANDANDAVMILDSDDDEPPASAPAPAEFEDEEPEVDHLRPFPPILQSIDIVFSVAATALAVSTAIENKIVLAAACADNKVRLVTLPLTPPTDAVKELPSKAGKYGESILTLEGFTSAPDLVAITSISSDALKSGKNILVAAHSRSVTGQLNIFTIPFTSSGLSKHNSKPSNIQLLSARATSLDFPPSYTNSCTLLLGDVTGTIRLFDVSKSAWLLSLHAPFSRTSPTSGAVAARKIVLSAKWVQSAQAILVLLQDGEWGVWDLYGTGPSPSSSSTTTRSGGLFLSASGIKGGGLTPFSVGGYIDGPPTKSSSRPELGASKFAPMTPHTRKTVGADISLSVGKHGINGSGKGGLDIRAFKRGKERDESVVMWVGESCQVIPSLGSYWEMGTKRSESLFGSREGRSKSVEGVKLRGEKCGGFVFGEGDEVVVLGEHRVVVVKDRPRKRSAEGGLFSVGREREVDFGESLLESEMDESLEMEFGDDLAGLESRMEELEGRRERSVVGLKF